ncbi:uncharacterized protein EDB93DRAFT_1106652 [Suillus bovinus]|uniref:uncharacterized protein n=1 Tax=Suillus bovinus TaxID=48563 RepID=UPI001B886F88|nr:uncharacterized protein EDB93DRAFT_1106652 [Suillus bovinus]KAG2137101.1 hypothetical protein EDB93DRAFT_1106652 [Suillus bovinus]
MVSIGTSHSEDFSLSPVLVEAVLAASTAPNSASTGRLGALAAGNNPQFWDPKIHTDQAANTLMLLMSKCEAARGKGNSGADPLCFVVHSEPLLPEAAEAKCEVVPEFSLEDFENTELTVLHLHLNPDILKQKFSGKKAEVKQHGPEETLGVHDWKMKDMPDPHGHYHTVMDLFQLERVPVVVLNVKIFTRAMPVVAEVVMRLWTFAPDGKHEKGFRIYQTTLKSLKLLPNGREPITTLAKGSGESLNARGKCKADGVANNGGPAKKSQKVTIGWRPHQNNEIRRAIKFISEVNANHDEGQKWSLVAYSFIGALNGPVLGLHARPRGTCSAVMDRQQKTSTSLLPLGITLMNGHVVTKEADGRRGTHEPTNVGCMTTDDFRVERTTEFLGKECGRACPTLWRNVLDDEEKMLLLEWDDRLFGVWLVHCQNSLCAYNPNNNSRAVRPTTTACAIDRVRDTGAGGMDHTALAGLSSHFARHAICDKGGKTTPGISPTARWGGQSG